MADDDDSLIVHISAREIYDQLVGVREDVRGLVARDEATARVIADHETRLRSVERWKYGIPLATVSAIAAIAASVQSFK
jgi:hypothetical protein